jgi:hypothetical protein
MAPKRKQPFRNRHELEYGLMVTSRDTTTSVVSSVACRFCISFGREEKVGQKRKSITTKKYFTAPFRPKLYRQHHESQHPSQWAEYSSASDDAKLTFFGSVVPVANRVTSHFEGGDGRILLNID